MNLVRRGTGGKVIIACLISLLVLSIPMNAYPPNLSEDKVYVLYVDKNNPLLIDPESKFIVFGEQNKLGENQISVYDLSTLKTMSRYAITGEATSYSIYGSYIAVGTSQGEILIVNTINNKIEFRFVAAHFGSVTKIGFLTDNVVVALFSSGRMITYDIDTGRYKVFTHLYANSSVEPYFETKPLNFFITDYNDLLVVEEKFVPRYAVFMIVVINSTSGEPMSNLNVWIDVDGNILTGVTNDKGIAEIYIPKPTTPTIKIYVESKELPGLAYYEKYTINISSITRGSRILKVYMYPYGELVPIPSVRNIFLAKYIWQNNDLVLIGRTMIPTTDIVNITLLENRTAYILVYYDNGNTGVRFISSDLREDRGSWIQYSTARPVLAVYTGKYLLIGFSNGAIFDYTITSYGTNYIVSPIHSYVFAGTPRYIGLYGDIVIGVDSLGYIYGLKMRANTLYPIYRNETLSIRLTHGAVRVGVSRDGSVAFIGCANRTAIIYNFVKAVSERVDLTKYILYRVRVLVIGEDGSPIANSTVVLENRHVYKNKTGANGVAELNYVLPGTYRLIVVPGKTLYSDYTDTINITQDTFINVTVPYREFNVSVEFRDMYTNGAVADDLTILISSLEYERAVNIPIGLRTLDILLKPGNYTMRIISNNGVYNDETILFNVPQNLSLSVELTRKPFIVGIKVIDNTTKQSAMKTFNITLRDPFNHTFTSTTNREATALFELRYRGIYSIIVTPIGDAEKYYEPFNGTVLIFGAGGYNVYVDRKTYNISIKIIDKDSNQIAENIIFSFDGKNYTLEKGLINLTVVAGKHSYTVEGGIYRKVSGEIEVTNDTTFQIEIRRKMASLKINVYGSFGEKMAIIPVVINGVDNSFTTVLYTDINGQIETMVPMGEYLIIVSIEDYKSVSQMIRVWKTTTIDIIVEITPLGLIKKYIVLIILAVAGVIATIVLYKIGRKKMEKFLITQIEEGI